jgi:undecaprenyl-diphosphatase
MRPRPFVALGITPLFPHDADSSFPSDHTLVGVALATPLVVRRIAGRWAAFILALGIGLARVAAAVHWPSDVLVSAALAVGLGALASWLVSCLLRMAPVQVWLQRSALLRRLAPLAGLPSA